MDELTRAVERLARHVGHWAGPRWALSAADGRPRATVMYELVQRVADRAADAEGQPHRVVPRLDNDAALPDQLRVVTADLRAAGPSPDVTAAVTADITATGRQL